MLAEALDANSKLPSRASGSLNQSEKQCESGDQLLAEALHANSKLPSRASGSLNESEKQCES